MAPQVPSGPDPGTCKRHPIRKRVSAGVIELMRSTWRQCPGLSGRVLNPIRNVPTEEGRGRRHAHRTQDWRGGPVGECRGTQKLGGWGPDSSLRPPEGGGPANTLMLTQ